MLLSFGLRAQFGIGGVSDSAEMRFSIEFEDLSFFPNNSPVTFVPNSGGNQALPIYQFNFPAKPKLVKGLQGINNFPVLKFDGAQYLNIPVNEDMNTYLVPDSNRSIFVVIKTGLDISSRQVIYEEGNSLRGFNFYIEGGKLYVGGWNLFNFDGADAPWGPYFSSIDIDPEEEYVISLVFDGNQYKTGTMSVVVNGEINSVFENVGRIYSHPQSNGLGATVGGTRFEGSPQTSNTTGNFYKGKLAQFVFYNRDVNNAERVIIEAGLAGKFNIDQTFDYYTQSEFNPHQIVGVGMDRNFSSHTSSFVGNLSILNPVGLDSNEFLIAGHDNGELSFNQQVPNNISQRMDRVWRVTETGDISTVDLSFHIGDFDGWPSNASEFVLLIDDDGDFSDATIHNTGISISNSIVTITGVDLAWSDFFTLGAWKSITWDGSTYQNGTGEAGAPGINDGQRAFYVNGSDAVISTDGNVDRMVLDFGTDLLIESNIALVVNNKITNNGFVKMVEHASLVQTHEGTNINDGNGTYKHQRTGLSNLRGYNLWSSPMDSAEIVETFLNANSCDIFLFNGETQKYLHDYEIGFQSVCYGNPITYNVNNVLPGSDGKLTPARGYYAPGNPVNTRYFEGKVNNGIYDFPIYKTENPSNVNWTGDDWNLTGNPYPGGLDAEKFWIENAINNNKIIQALYFWVDDNSNGSDYDEEEDFARWNLMGGVAASNGIIPGKYIASGQGFWVVANKDANVVYNNSMRAKPNNQFFKGEEKKQDPLNADRLWLSVESPANRFNQILVGFTDSATMDVDLQFDALKLKVSSTPNIILGSEIEGKPYDIQGQPAIEMNETREVPLILETLENGLHVFTLDSLDDMNKGYKIQIKDYATDKLTNVKEGPVSFYLDTAGLYEERFALLVTKIDEKSDVTSVDESLFDNKTQDVFFSTSKQVLNIWSNNNTLGKVNIVDVQGREVLSTSINAKRKQISTASFTKGIYFVRTTLEDGTVKVGKVVFN